MKYLILVGDGMGDHPIEELNGKTLLEAAKTPNMDRLASEGQLGLAQTVPQGMPPGSDVANMSLMGFDPKVYHTGRSPIEAAAMGLELEPNDIAFRCNFVTLSRNNDKTIMADYASGHIDTKSAKELLEALNQELGSEDVHFHLGQSYRHALIWRNGPLEAVTAPPHDHSDQAIDFLLNEKGVTQRLVDFTKKSWAIMENHPVNQKRIENGLNPANSIWLWGQGTKPTLPQCPKTGFTVSAVNLIKGLGILAGLEDVTVEGATAWLDTNYEGKVEATINGLKEKDLAFLHVEAPDEAGHGGILSEKLEAIELFDRKVVGPVLEGLKQLGEHRVLLATDHYTPISLKTHTSDPIPYVLWDSLNKQTNDYGFNESCAKKVAGDNIIPAYKLAERLLS